MRILLIQTPFTIYKSEEKSCHLPLGLAYICAALRNRHEVSVLDAIAEGYENEKAETSNFMTYGLPFEVIKNKIRDCAPDVVGVSWPFSDQSENVHRVCAIAKQVNPKIVTIVGGGHPSVLPLEVLKDINIDYVIIGEGEYSVKSLLEELEKGKKLLSTEGLVYRNNGNVFVNPKRNYIEELDKIAFPYWEAFPLERYYKINRPHGGDAKRTPFLPMITSRGCPFGCIFCSIHNIWGKNFRKRSPENVLSEIEYFKAKLGIKEILFEDDNLTLEKERCEHIFKGIIQRNLDLVWSAPNGVAINTIDEDFLSLMKDSGYYSFSFAVESGDEFVLKHIIKKPIQLSKIKPLVKKARNLGLEINTFFVVGLPDEKKEHIKKTFDFARELKVDNVNFFFATPLPGSELYTICREKGLISPTLDYRYLKSNKPSFATREFSMSQLEAMVLREKVILYLYSLLFRPKKFLAKLLHKFTKSPRYMFKLVYHYFKIEIFGSRTNHKEGF